jgi:hypothetical protein
LKDQIGAAPDIANTEVKSAGRNRPPCDLYCSGSSEVNVVQALNTMSAKTALLVSIERPLDWLKGCQRKRLQVVKMLGAIQLEAAHLILDFL